MLMELKYIILCREIWQISAQLYILEEFLSDVDFYCLRKACCDVIYHDIGSNCPALVVIIFCLKFCFVNARRMFISFSFPDGETLHHAGCL